MTVGRVLVYKAMGLADLIGQREKPEGGCMCDWVCYFIFCLSVLVPSRIGCDTPQYTPHQRARVQLIKLERQRPAGGCMCGWVCYFIFASM